MNRQRAFAGALLVQAGLGSILSWAMLFTRLHDTAPRNFPSSNCEAVLTSGLLAFAVALLAAGICRKTGTETRCRASRRGFYAGGFVDVAADRGRGGFVRPWGLCRHRLRDHLGYRVGWFPEKGIIAGQSLWVCLPACGFRIGEQHQVA
jgi:hypothetical protein